MSVNPLFMCLLMGARLYKTIVSQGCSSCRSERRQEAATRKRVRIAISAASPKGKRRQNTRTASPGDDLGTAPETGI